MFGLSQKGIEMRMDGDCRDRWAGMSDLLAGGRP